MRTVPDPALRRLPAYYHFLERLQEQGVTRVSCSVIGRELKLHPIQVRKDLQLTRVAGKPRVGYDVAVLRRAIGEFLDLNTPKRAVLVGAGSLGTSLLGYDRFRRFGLEIIAAFDVSPQRIGRTIHGVDVLPFDQLARVVRRRSVRLGIITVPAPAAQQVAEAMIDAGIQAIWNFAPVRLRVPNRVVVHHEDLYNSLAVLSCKLARVKPPEG